jgi:hypothetical protein
MLECKQKTRKPTQIEIGLLTVGMVCHQTDLHDFERVRPEIAKPQEVLIRVKEGG